MKFRMFCLAVIVGCMAIIFNGCAVEKVNNMNTGIYTERTNEKPAQISSKLDLTSFGIEKLVLENINAELISENIGTENIDSVNELYYDAKLKGIDKTEFNDILKFVVCDLKINSIVDAFSGSLELITEQNIYSCYSKPADTEISFFSICKYNDKYIKAYMMKSGDILSFSIILSNKIK